MSETELTAIDRLLVLLADMRGVGPGLLMQADRIKLLTECIEELAGLRASAKTLDTVRLHDMDARRALRYSAEAVEANAHVAEPFRTALNRLIAQAGA